MGDSSGLPSGSGPPPQERRAVPRYMFIAVVEIIEPASDVHMTGRVSEISRKGCFIDVLNPLPTGTLINVRVSCDKGTFATLGKIIYVQEAMGMGVAYMNTPPDQMKILDGWLKDMHS